MAPFSRHVLIMRLRRLAGAGRLQHLGIGAGRRLRR
jgi:hypothetical protein